MYVDDLCEKVESEVSAQGNLTAHIMKEEISYSVTSSLEFLDSE